MPKNALTRSVGRDSKTKTMIGSHDSLTGYPLRNRWLYPFNLFAKTQSKKLQEQLDAGVIYFDLRFRRVANRIYGAHGLNIYDITIEEVFDIINRADKRIIVRCIIEDGLFADDLTVEQLFSIVVKLKGEKIELYRIGLKSKWGEHLIINDYPLIGKVDYKLAQIKDKLKEIDEVSQMDIKEETIYETFTYKGIIPRITALFVNRKLRSKKMNDKLITFKDFVK